MAKVTRYKVKIKYFTENTVEYSPYCYDEASAKEFALAAFCENHTEKCIMPEVVEIKKM